MQLHITCERIFALATLVLFSGMFVGCGGPTLCDVTGVVKYPDGETLPQGGRVVFNSVTLQESFDAYTNAEGKYQLIAPPGEYRVIFRAPMTTGKLNAQGELEKGATIKPYASLKYANYDTSGLSYTVTDSGDNVYEIIVDRP